jgi:serine/threonine protein kinase/WD40 repeat protein
MPATKNSPFVDHVLENQLLDAVQREEFVRLQATISDPRELARELLRREWLTAYQVNQLLQGKTENLAVGPFLLLERIGEGGMGQVFKAKQKMLNRVVALKVIRKECLSNPRVILRFQREIRTSGAVSHPHIVRAFDADQVNGTYYIAMEYIEGVDLARLVRDNGPLRVDQACEYIRQAALGLQHASERGLVHRDIKPANLLVARAIASDRRRSSGTHRRPLHLDDPKKNAPPSPDPVKDYPWGVVKILDLGLARCTDANGNRASTHLTAIGAIMGTPEYIAPEQARDSHASDVRSDLYSLGCTFYFLLTGHPPFPEGNLTEKLLQHQTDEPKPVHLARRDRLLARQGANEPASVDKALLHVPVRVQDVIRKLMAKQPENRFQTPIELANELQTILQKWADGSLFAEEGAENSANMPIPNDLQFSPVAAADNATVVLSSSIPPTQYGSSSRRNVRKIGVLLAAGGALAFLGIATVFAAFLARSNFTQAGVVRDAPIRHKEAEEPHWKRLLKQAMLNNHAWEEARQEIRRQRTVTTNPERVKTFDALLANMPTPFDLLERSKFDGAMSAGLPADVIGVYGYSKANVYKPVTTLAVSSSGRWIAANEDNGVRLFDVQGSLIPHKIFAHNDRVTRLAFSPDGRVLATASDDGLVRMWDVATRTRLFSLDKHKRPVTQLVFNSDGSLLASAGRDGTIRLWDPRSGAEVRKIDASAETLAFAADGKLFWSGASSVIFWSDVKVGSPAGKLDTKIVGLRTLACQPQGNLIIAANGQGVLAVFAWDGVSMTEKATLSAHQLVHHVAFAFDGKSFVSAGNDPCATLWDAESLKSIKSWKQPRAAAHVAAFSPDGRHVVLGTANGQTLVVRLGRNDMESVFASLPR